MATTTPFAYNPNTPISGTIQVGDLAVGTTEQDYSSRPGDVDWWMGPDEDLGYVIAVPVPSNTQPTPIPGVDASVGFFRSDNLTDNSFINLTNIVFNQNFSSATDASIWLTNNGYWNSYPAPVLYLDAGNTSSYPGSGTVWTDIIGGKTFNLINGPTYDSGNDGKIYFSASAGQYAGCNSNLPDLNTWSVGVWHYYTGQNVGIGMCLVTEVYPGNTGNINYSLGDDNGNAGNFVSSGFFDGGWRTTGNYTLTPNNWYYIVGTYDGYTNNLYVNNTLVESSNYVGSPISSQGGINLMRRWDNPDFWDGYLSVVGIYNNALTSGQISGIWNTQKERFGFGTGFTITSGRVTNVSSFGAVFTNVTNSGYTMTNNNNNDLLPAYQFQISDNDSDIINAFTNAGMSLDYTGYIFNVTWGPGSTSSTLAKVSYDDGSKYMLIIAVDPTDTNWQTNNNVLGSALIGTFNFPATFTPYYPITDKNSWC